MRILPSGSGGSIYIHPGLTAEPLLAALVDPGRLRAFRPALRAGRLNINTATRKKHTPEQVVRKLATADRAPRDQYTTWTAVAPDLVFTVLTYGPSPLYGPPLVDVRASSVPRRPRAADAGRA